MNENQISAIADIIHNIAIEPSVLLLTSLPVSEYQKTFCQLPWSCVYTTCKDDNNTTTLFETASRRISGIVSDSNQNLIRLNRRELPLVYLLGNETDDIDPLDQEAITQNLIETIPQLLTTYGKLFIDCAQLSDVQDDLFKQL